MSWILKFKTLNLLLAAGLLLASFTASTPVTAQSGRDCDSNAIVYCGALTKSELTRKHNNGDSRNSAANIQRIFNHYGITMAETGNAVEGSVTSDGRVIVNGEVVATSARSTGRQPTGHSSEKAVPGGAYERPTSAIFNSGALSAYVYMPNGVFEWAVIKSCGNPVTANPKEKPKPGISIQKTVNANQKLTVGQEFNYQVVIKNTGETDLTEVVITDRLPAGIESVANPNRRTLTFNIGKLEQGKSVSRTIQARVTRGVAFDKRLINTACVDSKETDKKCDDVPVEVKRPVVPQSAFVCQDLSASRTSGNSKLRVDFTATGSATNASITGYLWDFGDGTTTETAERTATHVYEKSGTFTARVRVKTDKGTTDFSDDCAVKISVSKPEVLGAVAPTPAKPQVLAVTGPAETAAALMGSGGLGFGFRAYLRSRRRLIDALLDI